MQPNHHPISQSQHFPFLLFLVVLCAVACRPKITVLSHNVLAMAGYPKANHRTDTSLHAHFLKTYQDLNAHLIVLQEAPPEPYMKALARKLNMNYCYFGG